MNAEDFVSLTSKRWDFTKIVRDPVIVDIQSLVFEKAVKVDKGGALKKKVKGRLYRAGFAAGNRAIYIMTKPSEILHKQNDVELYLRKATEKEILSFFDEGDKVIEHLEGICKEYNLKAGKKQLLPEMLDLVLQKQKEGGIFYRLTLPVPKEELRKIKDLPDKIDEALDANMNKDRDLLYIARLHIPIVVGSPEVINPALVMQSAPHTLLFTSTKPGKTSTMRKVGIVLDRPSVANLLGFSTAHEKTEGKLNREVYPVTIDGIEEFEDENVAKGLLNYMENGAVNIARGLGVKTVGYSSLIFSSNPIGSDKDLSPAGSENLQRLDNLLMMLHSNQLGYGSRTGLFVFSNDMKEADGEGLPFVDELKLLKLLKSVQIALAPAFTQVLKNERVCRWISEQDDLILEYKEKLTKIQSADLDIKAYYRIVEFIQGNMSAFRHIKGAALRAAFMDFPEQMLEIQEGEPISDTYISMILERANFHLKKIIAINLKSFSELSSVLKKEDIRTRIYEGRYDSINTRGKRYESILLRCAANWYVSNEKIIEDTIANGKNPAAFLSNMKESYLAIPMEERRRSAYDSFNGFSVVVENNPSKINNHRQWLGFYLEKVDGSILIKFIAEKEWFEWVHKKFTNNKSVKPADKSGNISLLEEQDFEPKIEEVVEENNVDKSKKVINKFITDAESTDSTDDLRNGIGKIGKNSVGNESLYNQNRGRDLK